MLGGLLTTSRVLSADTRRLKAGRALEVVPLLVTSPATCGSDKGTSCRCYGRSGSRAVSLLRHPTEITAEQQQQNASKIQKGNTKATKAFQSIIPIV